MDNLTIWSVNMHIELQLLSDGLDVLQTLLVVGTGTADPDRDLVLNQYWREFSKCPDDTLECRGYVCEVGNTTSNEENASFRMGRRAEHKIQNCLCVEVCLVLTRSTRVFTIVGEFTGISSGCNGVGVDNGSTTTSNQSPDAASGVQNGQLEGGTRLSIKFGDVTKSRQFCVHNIEQGNTNASSLVISRPNGAGKSIGGPASISTLLLPVGRSPNAVGLRAMAHFAPHSNSAVWSSLAAKSRK